MIADQMEQWLYSDACDGLNIMFPVGPGRPRRFRRPRRPRTPAPQPLPPRIRRPDPARKPRPSPPRKPLFREAGFLDRTAPYLLHTESPLISSPAAGQRAVRVGWRADLVLLRVGWRLRAESSHSLCPWHQLVRNDIRPIPHGHYGAIGLRCAASRGKPITPGLSDVSAGRPDTSSRISAQ
jgi:hypothetical protein